MKEGGAQLNFETYTIPTQTKNIRFISRHNQVFTFLRKPGLY